MASEQLKESIVARAREIGFELCGFASPATPLSWSHFKSWLDAGYAGEMKYLPGRENAYRHPDSILPAVSTVIMVAICYSKTEAESSGVSNQMRSEIGRVARYAQGERDYHEVMRKKLKLLADFIHELFPQSRTRAVVDTAPLLERDFARTAGLGWFGKNTMLINKKIGSNFFIGAVLTDAELPADSPFESSHCGTCTRCLEVCPTDAFEKEYVLDARRCISYLTIEQSKQPIPLELRTGMQDWVFGCDLCQEVCPWNRHAPVCQEAEIQAHPEQLPSAAEFLVMSDEEFKARFKKSPLWRTGRVALARNSAIAIGNSGDTTHLPLLQSQIENDHPLIRGAVIWALGQLGDRETARLVQVAQKEETDPDVQAEGINAIRNIDKNNG